MNEGTKTVLLVALAVVAIGGGLVYWQYSNRSAAEQRVLSLEAQVPDETELKNDLAKSAEELENYQAQLNHLEKGVPTVAYVPTLLRELEQVGAENNIKVTGVRPVPITPNADESEDAAYREQEIDITGEGSYRAVMDLVNSLQTFPKVLAVQTIGLAPRQSLDAASGELNATVRLKAYVFKDAPRDELSLIHI